MCINWGNGTDDMLAKKSKRQRHRVSDGLLDQDFRQ